MEDSCQRNCGHGHHTHADEDGGQMQNAERAGHGHGSRGMGKAQSARAEEEGPRRNEVKNDVHVLTAGHEKSRKRQEPGERQQVEAAGYVAEGASGKAADKPERMQGKAARAEQTGQFFHPCGAAEHACQRGDGGQSVEGQTQVGENVSPVHGKSPRRKRKEMREAADG